MENEQNENVDLTAEEKEKEKEEKDRKEAEERIAKAKEEERRKRTRNIIFSIISGCVLILSIQFQDQITSLFSDNRNPAPTEASANKPDLSDNQPIDPTDEEGSKPAGSETDPASGETPERNGGDGGISGVDFDQMESMASDKTLVVNPQAPTQERIDSLLTKINGVIVVPDDATSKDVDIILQYGEGAVNFSNYPFGRDEAKQANDKITRITANNVSETERAEIEKILAQKGISLF